MSSHRTERIKVGDIGGNIKLFLHASYVSLDEYMVDTVHVTCSLTQRALSREYESLMLER